ncbi:MAG: DUF6498-containing protein [Pseudomonadota bacterium]
MFNTFSSLFLILANVIPLVGVLFFGWDAVLVLALFWIENLIIGVYNLIKMLAVSVFRSQWSKLGLTLFFVIHYGLFWTGHGLLLWNLLGFESIDPAQVLGIQGEGPLELFLEGFAIMMSFIERYDPVIWLGLGGLVMSHGVAFIERFILAGELFKKSVNQLMTEPYKHVLMLHAGLMAGAFILTKVGSPLWLLAVIVLIKMLVDARQHITANIQHSTSGQLTK